MTYRSRMVGCVGGSRGWGYIRIADSLHGTAKTNIILWNNYTHTHTYIKIKIIYIWSFFSSPLIKNGHTNYLNTNTHTHTHTHTHDLFASMLVLCLSSLFDIFHNSKEYLFLIKIQILLKTVTAYMYRYCTTYVTYIQQFKIIYLYRNYQNIPHGPRVCLRKNTSSIKIV